MSLETLQKLLEHGRVSEQSLFELFHEAIVLLQQRGVRVRITGDTLRAAAQVYDLGGDRVQALLPVAQVTYLYLGAPGIDGSGALEVFLSAPQEGFLEIATFQLSTHYGFKTVGNGFFQEGFGASVKQLFFTFPLKSIELYAPRKIAIYVENLSRPKRWRIDTISLQKGSK